MSGYDALDELYERLRGTEDARRAGGITPETIRAARGGVADGYGRELNVVDENAADGDSVPLVDISRDSRERIDADASELVADYARNGSVCDELYHGILRLLDRQAALTEREWGSATANERVAELQAKLDEYGQTHMALPLDADGVPIRVGDKILADDEIGAEYGATKVMAVDDCNGWVGYDGVLRCADKSRHVKPRTVEDVLREFGERVCRSGHQWGLDAADVVPQYAAEIRGLMGVDE